jgi:glucose 1-dehydrogenase
MKLSGKWALVTGGGRGIGRGISLGLAAEGCNVVVNYVSRPDAAQAAVAELKARGVEAYAVRADTSRRAEVDAMIAEVTSRNELHILIGNAGVVDMQPFLEITKEAWDLQINVNLEGSFNIGQAAARYFVQKGIAGKVVYVTSFNQEVPNGSQGVYSISKSGIKMLAKVMALELAEHGINVNTIAAGPVITDINRKQIQMFPGLVERLNKILPLHRWGTPEDMAKAAVFLASSDSDYITGSTIFVEGGIMINNGMMINVVE